MSEGERAPVGALRLEPWRGDGPHLTVAEARKLHRELGEWLWSVDEAARLARLAMAS